MKCEHCNNDMVWVGSLQGGRMACTTCAGLDPCDPYESIVETYMTAHNYSAPASAGQSVIHVGGSGGSGACAGPQLADMDFMDYDI